ncbi:Crp/Fnr family transcriptional regulator [Mycobacteroides abscessus]|nr:Crp/Fnr family transcriptional regulator [Mycobacteroides abscessus]ARQ64770.1 Crp/Fnr family transcriptional regulator [Mycobacteroides abscessus subsp. massiliense]MBN7329271.1 Crp/Fnr family transcriptional regulator [Mycobacteroides abscessus subsp. abscessus]MBN7334099.1 Crp/Fnr family transcriptional regulator [Mycobacteroides abscessus subsp. abscessus]MBN7366193.1 Crp/Fnr family transcriptional regulator [Mycobacteroides abscessus subsp. abscessus]MBN7425971.1 Crp/Fnr family transcr
MHSAVEETPMFRGMSTPAVAAATAHLTTEHFQPDEVIFRPGDPGDRMYLVTQGKVALSRRSRDGAERLATLVGPTEMFGEVSIFDPEPRTSEARALTAVAARGMDRDTMRWWIAHHSDAAEQLLRVLARQVRKATRKLADIPHADITARVAAQLLDLAQRFGTIEGDSVYVEHGLSQLELADLVGTSRESMCRVLHEFEKRGLIQVHGPSLTIYDCEVLSVRNHAASGVIEK